MGCSVMYGKKKKKVLDLTPNSSSIKIIDKNRKLRKPKTLDTIIKSGIKRK
jgi:hypothetical protein